MDKKILNLALGAGLVGLAGVAHANTVLSHSGTTNPSTEGWSVTTNYLAASYEGGVGPVTVGGVDAWRVYDVYQTASDSQTAIYRYNPGAYNTVNPVKTNAADWMFSALIDPFPRVGINANSPNSSLGNASFKIDSFKQWTAGIGSSEIGLRYAVYFEELADGTAKIYWENYASTYVAPAGFNWVELSYDTGIGKAALYLNGTLLDADVTPAQGAPIGNAVEWGDRQYAYSAAGGADWAQVRFERGPDPITLLGVASIPEPETYALMLAGLGLVGFAARRRAASSN